MSAESIPPLPPAIDAAGVIVGDVRCFRCQGKLTGTLWQGNCPGCGSPASASLSPEVLRAGPPRDSGQDVVNADLACRRCLTNLRGQSWNGLCQQCQLPVHITRNAPAGALLWDAAGVIQTDVICRQCGYNLRGLKRDGRCPECAASVAASAREDWLAFSEPNWVRKLARGSRLIMNGLTLSVAAVVAFVVVSLLMSGGGARQSSAFAVMAWAALGCFILGLIGTVLTYIGIWFLTAPDPSRVARDQPVTARRLVRVALLLGVVGLAFDWGMDRLPPPPPTAQLALVMILFGFMAVSIAGTWAYFRYLAGLAQQIPAPALAGRSRFLAGGLTITLSFFVLYAFVGTVWSLRGAFQPGPAAGPARPRPLNASGGIEGLFIFLTCMGTLSGLLLLVFSLMALRLQWRLKQAFERQAEIAERNWSRSGGAASHG